jgi:hypothetical protein
MIDTKTHRESPVAPEEVGVDRMAGGISDGSDPSVERQSERPIERAIDVLLDEVDLVEQGRRRSQHPAQ